jgi:hypothetical protein
MVLRIELEQRDGETIFMLIGRMTSRDVQQLKAQMADRHCDALDLQQVRLVDLDAVHFLAEAERGGIELRRVPPYIGAWVVLERPRVGRLERRRPSIDD